MKTELLFQDKIRSTGASALLLILATLALITVVVVAFFTNVSNEATASKSETETAVAAKLSDSVVNLVMATISTATTGKNQSGAAVCWASQPGMIRTWGTDGKLDRVFRLYSAPNVIESGTHFDHTADSSALALWKSGSSPYNALWCDLNSPASAPGSNALIYPIVTPPTTLDSDSGVQIEDPAAGKKGVQGFSITSSPGFTSGAGSHVSSFNNPAPMPVQWVYVLKDGTLVSADAASSTTGIAKFTGTSAPTSANPIVGRMAFWTDDETCKVNINTASEGIYWGVPTLGSKEEVDMGHFQPGHNEFQRYPGHPAMTSLSAVFPNFSGTSSSVYDLIPRIQFGGSKGGVQQVKKSEPIVPDPDRLFASVDEFYYQSTLSGSTRTTATSLVGSASDTDLASDLSRRRFFLTASSRAPETTLFETPRISLWPITTDNPNTATITGTREDIFDKMLRFCATTGTGSSTKDYFFARANPLSPTYDYSNIPRNQDIYKYLQNLTNTSIPGFNGSFVTKYSKSDVDALLTQAFDYIRSGPNLIRASDLNSGGRSLGGYTLGANGLPGIGTSFCQLVVPIRINNTVGMGNFRFITQVGLGFYAEKVEPLNAAGNAISATGTDGNPRPMDPTNPLLKPVKVRYTIRPYLLVETFQPTAGWPRTASFYNSKYTTADSSPRYQANLIGGNLSIALGSASAPAGTLVSGGQIDFPWNQPCEMRISQPYGASFGDYRYFVGDAEGFILQSTTSRSAAATGYQDGVNPLNAYTYRAKTPVVMEFDLPSTITGETIKEKLWVQRIEALLTHPGTVKNAKVEDPPSGWAPRMSLNSTGTLQVQLGFTSDANTSISSSDVVQTVQVQFPTIPNLPVPSQAFSTSLNGGIDYKALSSGTLTDIKTWGTNGNGGGFAAHEFLKKEFYKRWVPDTSAPNTSTNGQTYCTDPLAQPGDVVRSYVASGAAGPVGDWRLLLLQPGTPPTSWFDTPTPAGFTAATGQVNVNGQFIGDDYRVHSIAGNLDSMETASKAARLVAGVDYTAGGVPRQTSSSLANGATIGAGGVLGDWNDEFGPCQGGATFSMPDVGALGPVTSSGTDHYSYFQPDFLIGTTGADGVTNSDQYKMTYSPNRQMYSAMQMGSLLTQVASQKPWQTLLFCPNSEATIAGSVHPGQVDPPDHLFADWFWMPIVDPYPISEPFSTAGKINLNYRIEPFNYIQRATGIHALMKATKITAISDSYVSKDPASGLNYKMSYYGSRTPDQYPANTFQCRYPIAIDETLKAFKAKFDAGEVFKSATQISEMFLYPADATGQPLVTYDANKANIINWWSNKRLTGDNNRELPYAHLHPRITTKSNTFTVHMRVQALQKRRNSAQDIWEEGRDQVVSEYRGSTLIERFVDPNDPNLSTTDLLTDTTRSLSSFYRWRVVQKRQFVP